MTTHISVVDDYTLSQIEEGAAAIIYVGGAPPGYEPKEVTEEDDQSHVMTATKVVKAPAKAPAAKATEGVETK